tara:strand:+ start:239 stop:619 length:381 start_codon:yes stop_codon:yes gene_type:complete
MEKSILEEEEEKEQTLYEKIMSNPIYKYTAVGITVILLIFIIYLIFFRKNKKASLDMIYAPTENMLNVNKSILKQIKDSKSKLPKYFRKYKIADTEHDNVNVYKNQYDRRTFVQGADGKFYKNLKS